MFEKLEIFRQAHALAQHASARQGAIARNVANADTPGYRPVDVASFSETYRTSGEQAVRTTRPGHLTGTAQAAGDALQPRVTAGAASPNGNAVSLETEMMKAAEVRASHDMALSIYQSSLGILRASLGRGR